MLAKLQAFGQAAKSVVLYILTPVLFILGLIFILWKKNDLLNDELEEQKSDDTIKTEQQAISKADLVSAHDIDDYERLRSAYLASQRPASDPSMRQGNRGSKTPNK